jgi:receptor expression-enhancing protein 5/6
MIFIELLKKAEDETGVPKVFFFILAGLLLSGLTLAVGGFKFVVDLLGFLYPAYMSFKSLEANNKDDTQWLTYWVAFSFFSILENVFGFVVAMIPFYYFIKAGTIVWMYHPKTMGAKVVYQQGLRPLLLPYIETTTTKKSE